MLPCNHRWLHETIRSNEKDSESRPLRNCFIYDVTLMVDIKSTALIVVYGQTAGHAHSGLCAESDRCKRNIMRGLAAHVLSRV